MVVRVVRVVSVVSVVGGGGRNVEAVLCTPATNVPAHAPTPPHGLYSTHPALCPACTGRGWGGGARRGWDNAVVAEGLPPPSAPPFCMAVGTGGAGKHEVVAEGLPPPPPHHSAWRWGQAGGQAWGEADA
jgi:hypothetical protein